MKSLKQVLLISISIIISSCGTTSQNAESTEETFDATFLESIEISTVSMQNVERQIKLTGKVDYDPDRLVRYISPVGGTVASTHFHFGDRVERGQTMAVVRSAELSEMEAERKSLEAEIIILQRELESVQSMYRDSLASHRELLAAQGQLKQAVAALEKTRTTLSLYGSSGSDGTFVIRSPIGGFVVDRDIVAGTHIIAESAPLFAVADISRVWIIASVYVGNLAFVKKGMPVEIKTSAWADERFYGRIDVMSQALDPEERVLKARIVMPNADLRFKPGMAVDLTLRNSRNVQMAAVPAHALIFDDNRHFVVKQTADGFVIAEVTLFAQTGGTGYIEAGLEAGDRVVVKNHLLMYGKLKN
jgi:cobalt-zinc-cadmium efflux system membrane fusion protein